MAGNEPTLRNGSVGAYVQLLQTALNIAPSAYSYLALDGIFGPLTDKRVREFQIRDDGIHVLGAFPGGPPDRLTPPRSTS